MKRKRCSVEQIVAVLKQTELGLPVADLTLDKVLLQDVLGKSSNAITTADRGGVSLPRVPHQRTPRLWGHPLCPLDRSLSESPESAYRGAAADPRPGPRPGALWLSQDSRAAQARGVDHGEEACVSAVLRRGLTPPSAAPTTTEERWKLTLALVQKKGDRSTTVTTLKMRVRSVVGMPLFLSFIYLFIRCANVSSR